MAIIGNMPYFQTNPSIIGDNHLGVESQAQCAKNTKKNQFNIIRNDNSLAINGDPYPSKLYKVLLSYTLFPPRVYILPSGNRTWQAARFPRNRGFPIATFDYRRVHPLSVSRSPSFTWLCGKAFIYTMNLPKRFG